MAPRTGAIRTLYNQKLSEQPSSRFISKNGKNVAAPFWFRRAGESRKSSHIRSKTRGCSVLLHRPSGHLPELPIFSFLLSSGLLRARAFRPLPSAFPRVSLSVGLHPRALERKWEELSESRHEKMGAGFVTGPNY